MEKTLVMIKPDCVERHMSGSVILAIESIGLEISQLQMKQLSRKEACSLYAEHKGKWHFERNINHVTSGPVILIEVEGPNAVPRCREIVETYRRSHKDLIELPRNLVHATTEATKADEELLAVGLDNHVATVYSAHHEDAFPI
jgi:nucleoside-diphosphate kinase